jgi:hypothetical protein
MLVNQVRKRLTYANVMSSVAIFLVLGGAAVAAARLPANSVGAGQIQKSAVRTGKLAPEAVRAGKLAKNAVTTDRLREESVATQSIAKLAVNTSRISNKGVKTGKLENESVTSGKLGNEAVTGAKLANGAVGQQKLSSNSVGASQFKGIVTRTTTVTVPKESSASVDASCQSGEKAIGVGTDWSEIEKGLTTSYARISGNGAEARGNNDTTEPRSFTVEAYCWSS